MKLHNLLYEQAIKLRQIPEYETDFGKGYDSSLVNGNALFYEILVDPLNNKVGELEYGIVDDKSIEIISIHVNKEHRGKGIAQKAIGELVRATGKKNIIVLVAPSSIKFWKKFGFQPWSEKKGYYTKTFA